MIRYNVFAKFTTYCSPLFSLIFNSSAFLLIVHLILSDKLWDCLASAISQNNHEKWNDASSLIKSYRIMLTQRMYALNLVLYKMYTLPYPFSRTILSMLIPAWCNKCDYCLCEWLLKPFMGIFHKVLKHTSFIVTSK